MAGVHERSETAEVMPTRNRGVAAVFRIDHGHDEILMVQHATPDRVWWTLPGGAIEPGETAAECSLRELREETGLVGRVVRHLYDSTGPNGTESCWLLDAPGGTAALGHDPELPADAQELVDVAWLPVEQVRTDRQVGPVLAALAGASSNDASPRDPGGEKAVARQRAAVVIVDEERVALIRRLRHGHTYHLFPGGGVEPGESLEDAAVREALEELGVEVQLGRLLGTVTYGASQQTYFEAVIMSGAFGTGTGAEMHSPPTSAIGSYEPVWAPVRDLVHLDTRPLPLAEMLASGTVSGAPFVLAEDPAGRSA